MLTKVETIDMVPDDIKELLLPNTGEYVVIGSSVYNLKPFPVKKYFELLHFLSKYFTEYNEVFADQKEQRMVSFLGALTKKLIDKNLLDEFMSALFPEIPEAVDNITFDQLKYLLGVIYKLNFLSKNRQIQNMEMRTASAKMMQMLGLNLTIS